MYRKFTIIFALIVPLILPLTGEGARKTNLSESFASFIGEEKYDNAGGWVSTIGDINGDGFYDVMIGANNNDDGGDNAGKCYLFFGKPSGWKMDIELSDADVMFIGESDNNRAGMSGSMLGDVNGDGIDDFIIGASYFTSGEGENIGKSYLFFGKKSGWKRKNAISSADVVFPGERSSDNSGGALASAGDVNGDGLMDFLISAKNNDDGGDNAGKVYLILGKEQWPHEVNLSSADASFIGRDKDDAAGRSIASAGDINGDGYDDFLIGAPNNTEGGVGSGQVYLILGKKGVWKRNFDLNFADTTFTGEAKGDSAGVAVSRAGDVDNDGIGDFLISAPYNSEAGKKAGKVYLFYGRAEKWKRNFSLNEADVSFTGEKAKDNLGRSIAFCSDTNGDGIDDFMLSAPRNSEGGSRAGKIYLLLGRSGERFSPKSSPSISEYQFMGEKKKNYAGNWISFGGDIDGDGINEFLVGAESNSEGGKSSGQVYLLKLKANTPPTQIERVSFKSDFTYEKTLDTELESGDTLYMEIRAEDTDTDKINILPAFVSTSKKNRIPISLVETSNDSGVFRGRLLLSERGSNRLSRRLRVQSGDTIVATAKTNREKYAIVSLKVAFSSCFVDDDNIGFSQGNNNNHLEPGENIELELKLINHYFQTVKNVRAKLSSPDPHVTITNNLLKFEDIPTKGSAISQNRAHVALAKDTPQKYGITFNITVTDSAKNRWEDTFIIVVEDIITISGQVTDRSSGRPLPGVSVSSSLGSGNTSDKAGRYLIHIPKPKSGLSLTFSHQQYLDISKFFDLIYLENAKNKDMTNVTLQRRISLDEANVSLMGESVRDASGAAVSYAGDVNGDGYDDVLVGAWSNDEGGTDAGKAYLIFGKPGKWSKTLKLGQADASFIGEKPYDEAGRNLGYVGDVNKDGFDDFIIGASGNDERGDKTGQTYLILGKATGWAKNVPLYYADASFLGQKPYDRAGVASYAGDVNGDGYDDFIIAGWSSDTGGIDSGQVYLIFGKPTGWEMDTSLDFADATFLGEKERDEAGKAITWAGDVNGDGYDDILIGSPSNSDYKDFSGKTYLIFGRSKGWRWHVNLRYADASFMGEDSDDASGSALCGLGDVNGDGYGDFLIGAWSNNSAGFDAGKAYLFFGKPSPWRPNTLLSTADVVFTGEEEKDGAALSISYAGDINGDGYDDIFIGAWGSNYGGNDSGQSYVIFGKPTGWKREMSLREADLSFYGKNNSDSAGRAISYAGDINADGIDDLIIGAWGSNVGKIGAGESYLIFVNKNTPPHNIKSIKLNIADSFSMPDPLELEEHQPLFSDKYLSMLEENWSQEQGREVNSTKFNQLYVILSAEDTEPDKINVTEVFLNSPASLHDMPLRLYETDYNSGKFLGRIKISSRSSSRFSRRILAHGQSPLTISSKEDGAKSNQIFVKDFAPPMIDNLKPDHQQRQVSISSTLVAHVKDPGIGVDKASIKMLINDTQIQPIIEGDPADYRLSYTPPDNFPFGTAIKVTIFAGDKFTPPNIAEYSYSFHIADRGILLNPGFEQDFTNWNVTSRPGLNVSIDSTVAHTGLKSCKLQFTGTDDIKYQHLSQGPIPVKPNTGYLLRGFMKSENLSSASGVRLYVEGSRLPGKETEQNEYFNAQSNEILGTNDWDDMAVSFHTLSDTTNIFVYIVRWDTGEQIGGTCWLDDLYLMEESEDGYTGSKIKTWLIDFLTE